MQGTHLSESKQRIEINAKLNFNHEFREKFIVLEDKRFNNKIRLLESIQNKPSLKPTTIDKKKEKILAVNLKPKIKVNNVKINNQNKQATILPASHNIKQINSSTQLFTKAKNTNKIEINKVKSNSSSIFSTMSSSNSSSRSCNNNINDKIDKRPIIVKKFTSNKPLDNKNQDENVAKKRANQTAALNTKAKLLNRVKQKQKKTQIDNKVSANLLNELMSSLITYIKDNNNNNKESIKKSKKTTKNHQYSTDISINESNLVDKNNLIVEEYLQKTFTDTMDLKRPENSSALTSPSSSYSSLSRATVSSNSSSSYFKMFSRPNYYKKLNENKNNTKPLPASSTCSSLSTFNTNTTNIQSSLYLSCDDFTENNANNNNDLPLSNKSVVSNTSSNNHRQLEIPNIDDPILFIDTLYNQLLANNNNININNNNNNYRSGSNSTEKICLYDTDYTCRSSSRLTSPHDHVKNMSRSSVSRSNSSIEVSEIHMDDSHSLFKSNLLLTNCYSLLNDESRLFDYSNHDNNYGRRRLRRRRQQSASNLNSITVDCSNMTRCNETTKFNNYSIMTSSSQSSPSLSFLTSTSSASMNSSSLSTNRVKHKLRNRNLYLSASWANLCSSSSFSPSMSTSMSSSNHPNSSINNTTTTNNNNNSNDSQLRYLYNIQRNPQLDNNDYYLNNKRLLMAKSKLSDVTTKSTSTTSYMQIIFDSFLKSIKFLIMTKNVLILPLIIYLLNNKLKQFIRNTTNQSTSLLSSAASSIMTTASKSTKMKLNL